ncbi:MAG: head-tail adaptor protein [Pseudomonadota bacterium]
MMGPSLDTPMLLEAPQRLVDTGGGTSIVWSALGTVWADIAAKSGRETVAGLRENARISHQITVRSAPIGSPQRPRPEQRFRLGDRLFAIRAVAPADGAGRHLTCWVEEGPFS